MYVVAWMDACSSSGWHDVDELGDEEKHYLVLTTGFIVAKDKDYICVAQSAAVSDDGTYADILSIPRGMVKKIERLR